MCMSWDIPLSPGFPDQSEESKNTSWELQMSIAEKIETLLWFQATNKYFIQFINEFGHPNQLKCEPNDTKKIFYNTKLRDWENKFTDSFYRAARIVAQRKKLSFPNALWINMEEIIREAEELLHQENEGQKSAWKEIGYWD